MDILKLFRPQQWSKNLTIYVVLLASGNYDVELFKELSIVFIGFSLIVSSTYIINDVIDRKSDREHPSKKNRPIASGKVSNNFAVKISITIFLVGKFILSLININLLILNNNN